MRVLAVILLLIASFSIALAASRYRLAAETSTTFICGDEKTEEHLRQLMLGALDSALHDHIAHVFDVWMKDEREQPARAKRGVQQGTSAYLRSRDGVMKWKLARCP